MGRWSQAASIRCSFEALKDKSFSLLIRRRELLYNLPTNKTPHGVVNILDAQQRKRRCQHLHIQTEKSLPSI